MFERLNRRTYASIILKIRGTNTHNICFIASANSSLLLFHSQKPLSDFNCGGYLGVGNYG